MTGQQRRGWSVFLFMAVGLALDFVGCRPTPDFKMLGREILELHQQTEIESGPGSAELIF